MQLQFAVDPGADITIQPVAEMEAESDGISAAFEGFCFVRHSSEWGDEGTPGRSEEVPAEGIVSIGNQRDFLLRRFCPGGVLVTCPGNVGEGQTSHKPKKGACFPHGRGITTILDAKTQQARALSEVLLMGNSSHESTIEVLTCSAPRTFRIRVLFGKLERSRTLRRGTRVIVGSGPEADLRVPDPTVSGRHCELALVEDGLHLRDLESKNGTFVAASKVRSFVFTGRSGSFAVGNAMVFVETDSGSREAADLGLVGTSEALARVRECIRQFARLRAPVLITGESGTGKDVVARALHAESGRTGAYCPLNVAALSENLLDGELFGHERGAFTGAVEGRKGMFEAANGGTLFLDELAEMSAAGQAKLLRVTEDGHVRALGSERSRAVDVRLVSATCAPLREEINKGRFRHDLFHRLSTLEIHLPPLRKRSEDIPVLARFLLHKMAPEVGEKIMLPSTEELLRRQAWPGNVRELSGALYRAAALSEGDILDPSQFTPSARVGVNRSRLQSERAMELLDIHGNVSAAARAAGVPRTTFRTLLGRKPDG